MSWLRMLRKLNLWWLKRKVNYDLWCEVYIRSFNHISHGGIDSPEDIDRFEREMENEFIFRLTRSKYKKQWLELLKREESVVSV